MRVFVVTGFLLAFAAGQSLYAKPTYKSQFTSLKKQDCKLKKHQKRGEAFVCKGKSRYKIQYKGNETIGQHIYIEYSTVGDDQAAVRTKLLHTPGIKIHRLGDTAEWRRPKHLVSGGAVAVIIPVTATSVKHPKNKPSRYYVTVKLGRESGAPCVVYLGPAGENNTAKDKLYHKAIAAADTAAQTSCTKN